MSDDVTCVLKKGDDEIVSKARGIRPLIDLINDGKTYEGYSAADKIVGKAAALLFVKAKVKSVYAEVASEPAEAVFRKAGVPFSYGTLTRYIVNRSGDGPCPMEATVFSVDDPEQAFILLRNKLLSLSK